MTTVTANLDYADEYGDGTIALHPTVLPIECNFPEGSSAYENVANVRFLFQHGIINWPNFTHCLPNCGLCTQFASDHTYLIYNLVVIGFLLPFISLCGLCGNIISAFVYSRPSMRQSYTGSIYLSALGCSDTAVIVTALFLFFIDSIRRYSLNLNIIYGSLSPIVYPAGMIAQTCSVYFTMVAGIDCFVQVCMPENVKKLFSSRRFTKWITSLVLVFAFFYNIPHCFESVLLDCWHVGFQSPSVEVCPAPLRFHPTYTLIYYKYMYAIFLAVGPLLVLIALNTIIILATVVCKKGNSSDNLALILVVLLFILCNTIALLINIFETHLSAVMSWRINYIIDVSNLLVVFNSSFNFIIYYNFSRPFRCTFCHHFGSNSAAYQKSPSICSRSSSIHKRRVIGGMDGGQREMMANGHAKHKFTIATANGGTDLKDQQMLLLRFGRRSTQRRSTKTIGGTMDAAAAVNGTALANRLSMPLLPVENGQQKRGGGWENGTSRLLFVDQTEGEEEDDHPLVATPAGDECIWQQRSGGQAEEQEQIWLRRPILKNTHADQQQAVNQQQQRPLCGETKMDATAAIIKINGEGGGGGQPANNQTMKKDAHHHQSSMI